MKKHFTLFALFCCLTAFHVEKTPTKVVLSLDKKPTKPLFSVNIVDESTQILSDYLYQSLMDYDPKTLDLVPVLAQNLPESSIKPNGEHHLKFKLNSVSKWDNRFTIKNEDVEFSLKLLFCCGNQRVQSYFKNFKRIELDRNRKVFTLVFYQYHFLNKINSAELTIYPKHFYDKKGILDKYTIETIRTEKDTIEALQTFSENYLSKKSSIGNINGSGAYNLKQENSKTIIFERKKHWWCDVLSSKNNLQQAYPQQIVYKIIPNQEEQLKALKAGELDILNQIPPNEFVETYQKDSSFKANYKLFSTPQDVYSYIGFNLSHPMLDNKKVRQALAHLMNRTEYLNNTFYGFGHQIEHPFSDKVIKNPVKVYDFNTKKALQLLKEAGWQDRNNNGTLDNAINSELEEFEVTILYSTFIEGSEKGSKIFQENCAKVGIKVRLEKVEFGDFIRRLERRDFDMYFGSWLRPTIENDIAQLFHSSTAEDGLNYCNLKSSTIDDLLEQIVAEPSFDKRKKLYQQLAEAIKDESPYIFLITTHDRIAIRQSYTHVIPSFFGHGVYIPALY